MELVDHNLPWLGLVEKLLKRPTLGGDRLELTLVPCSIEQTGNGIVLTQVNCQNLHAILQLWEGGLSYFFYFPAAYIDSLYGFDFG